MTEISLSSPRSRKQTGEPLQLWPCATSPDSEKEEADITELKE